MSVIFISGCNIVANATLYQMYQFYSKYHNIFYRLEYSMFLSQLNSLSVFTVCLSAALFSDCACWTVQSLFFGFLAVSLSHSHCIQQILESVNHCHLNGIVHRDLKVSMTGSNLFEQTINCWFPLWTPPLLTPDPSKHSYTLRNVCCGGLRGKNTNNDLRDRNLCM